MKQSDRHHFKKEDEMNYCEFVTVNFTKPDEPPEECDAPASVRIAGRSYCERHADMLTLPTEAARKSARPPTSDDLDTLFGFPSGWTDVD
jgi:hypothetical protein